MRHVIVCCSALLLWSSLAAAQTANPPESGDGIVRGVIQDPTGAAVSGARIRIRSIANPDKTWSIASNPRGEYVLAIAAATYIVEVSAQGFANGSQTVAVTSGATTTADFSLSIPGVREVLTVTQPASP